MVVHLLSTTNTTALDLLLILLLPQKNIDPRSQNNMSHFETCWVKPIKKDPYMPVAHHQ
jgi:hypothetical protein